MSNVTVVATKTVIAAEIKHGNQIVVNDIQYIVEGVLTVEDENILLELASGPNLSTILIPASQIIELL